MHDQLIEHFRFHAAESIGVDAVQDHPESEVVFDAVEIEQSMGKLAEEVQQQAEQTPKKDLPMYG